MIPSGYKEDVVYSQIPTNGNGDLSFTRASNGTRVNSAGLVEVAPWNLLEYSEQFDNAYWNKYQSVITANATTAPNGTTTADKFEYTTTGTAVLYATSSALSSQVYALSCYGKKGTTDILQIGFTLGSGDKIANFNLNTGVITTTSSGVTASIESVGNGWFRCVMSLTTDINTPNIFVNSTSGTTGNYIYIWGAQLNIGSTAKPYFPTTDRLNVPRLTYQNGGGGCPSLLLEKQSTNVILYSEQFDDASWTKNVSVTANAIISPDGTQNADKILESASNVQQWAYQSPSMTGAQTATIYAKKGERNYIALATAGLDFSYFNLDTGVVVSSASGATTSIQSAGNGWYRCSVNASTPTSTFFIVAISDNGTRFQYAGDTSKGVYVWGAQNEASSYPTSYIPTTSSSATRVADACFKTGISSLIGQTEGVVFADFYWNGNAVENWLGSVQTSTTNFVAIFLLDDGRPYYYILNSGSAQMAYIGTALSIGRHKMAIGYKQNDSVAYMDGNLLNADTSCTIPATSEYRVGGISSTSGQEARINQAVLFPTRLTNAELASLTTI